MKDAPKAKTGRPPGRIYPHRVTGFLSDTTKQAFDRWCKANGYSQAEGVREAARQAAEGGK